jgi:heme/copper-type cytochrome/quinol oxidase subunit 1
MSYTKYEKEQDLLPQYEITKELSDLKLMFIISSIIYFLVGGSLAIIMQIIQSKVFSLRLFYAALTIHGQVIFLDLFRY